jgi:hypothetical protein
MKFTLLAAALAFGAATASAQTIYTTVSIDGQKTFSDFPHAAAEPQTEFAPEAETPKASSRISGISSRRTAARIDATEATRRLERAQLERQRGARPLAGEKTQIAGTGTVNYRYWRRQEQLRRNVEQAQRRVNETLRPQLARQ